MRIAVVGAGVSGLVAAWLLARRHEVHLFEGGDRPGGHTDTVPVEIDGRSHDVDTGFVVYNETTYPLFVSLLRRLGVRTKPTSMSFSVQDHRTGLEYCGTSLNTLFAQRRNLLRPSFYRMLRDIVRFNREAHGLLEDGACGPSLGELVASRRYSREFLERYLAPMAAAIWSQSPAKALESPAAFLIRFFRNHGLLSVGGHLAWRVVEGGSQRYVDAMMRSFAGRLHLGARVGGIRRVVGGVELGVGSVGTARFDHVVLACHSDQALASLAAPTEAERQILGAIPYQVNEAVLHTDRSLLPRSRRAWASWNYHVPRIDPQRVMVTYNMTRLQSLETRTPVCVTLNWTQRIDPAKRLRILRYAHPVFSPAAIEAQTRWNEISGVGGVHFCGAYWSNGFHEDGVRSAVRVAERFGETL